MGVPKEIQELTGLIVGNVGGDNLNAVLAEIFYSPSELANKVLDVETLNRRESNDDYFAVIAQLNDRWRVIISKNGIKWILQFAKKRRGGVEWASRSYVRRRDALMRVSHEHAGEIERMRCRSSTHFQSDCHDRRTKNKTRGRGSAIPKPGFQRWWLKRAPGKPYDPHEGWNNGEAALAQLLDRQPAGDADQSGLATCSPTSQAHAGETGDWASSPRRVEDSHLYVSFSQFMQSRQQQQALQQPQRPPEQAAMRYPARSNSSRRRGQSSNDPVSSSHHEGHRLGAHCDNGRDAHGERNLGLTEVDEALLTTAIEDVHGLDLSGAYHHRAVVTVQDVAISIQTAIMARTKARRSPPVTVETFPRCARYSLTAGQVERDRPITLGMWMRADLQLDGWDGARRRRWQERATTLGTEIQGAPPALKILNDSFAPHLGRRDQICRFLKPDISGDRAGGRGVLNAHLNDRGDGKDAGIAA